MHLDDYTLAAYISGELPDAQRSTVAAALIADRESREILHMACEALAAAMEHEPIRQHLTDHASREPIPGARSADRTPIMGPRGEA